jgi:hypothetical protein
MAHLLILLAPVMHELGHFLAALATGHRLKFRFGLAKGIVPRLVWDMPDMEAWKQKLVAAAGFGLEFAMIPAFGKYYAVFAACHLIAYKFYAGEASDFKWFGL